MRRISPRDFTMYMLLILTVAFATTAWQQMEREDAPDYSQIRTYFVQERVSYFTLKDNVLTLTLREAEDKTSTVTYQLADHQVFYLDMRELIDQQLASGVLTGYDYPPGLEGTWWYNLLPTLLDKPDRRAVPVQVHYSGFTIPDAFVVGYGLDYAEQYRNLPYIGILKPEVYGG